MMRRWIALSVCAGTIMIVFACGQKQVADSSDSGADSAVSNDSTVPIFPTDGPPSVLDGAGGSSISCPDPVDETTILVWAAPQSGTVGACTDKQIDLVVNGITSEDLMGIYSALAPKSASDKCQSCVFSAVDDPNWQVIVWTDETDGIGFLNYGACYALAPGGTAACGKAVETEKLCQVAACPGTSCENVEECFSSADESVCGPESDQTDTACGAQFNALTAACGSLGNVLQVVCGGGSSDAGTDASSDAAAD